MPSGLSESSDVRSYQILQDEAMSGQLGTGAPLCGVTGLREQETTASLAAHLDCCVICGTGLCLSLAHSDHDVESVSTEAELSALLPEDMVPLTGQY